MSLKISPTTRNIEFSIWKLFKGHIYLFRGKEGQSPSREVGHPHKEISFMLKTKFFSKSDLYESKDPMMIELALLD